MDFGLDSSGYDSFSSQPSTTDGASPPLIPSLYDSSFKGKDATENSQLPANWVVLVVGGKRYETTIETLTRDEEDGNGYFSNIVSDKWREGCSGGPIRIDRDGKLFSYILNWKRSNKTNLPDDIQTVRNILDEAEFFCITSLSEHCKMQLQRLKRRRRKDKQTASQSLDLLKSLVGPHSCPQHLQENGPPSPQSKSIVRFANVSPGPSTLGGSERTPLAFSEHNCIALSPFPCAVKPIVTSAADRMRQHLNSTTAHTFTQLSSSSNTSSREADEHRYAVSEVVAAGQRCLLPEQSAQAALVVDLSESKTLRIDNLTRFDSRLLAESASFNTINNRPRSQRASESSCQGTESVSAAPGSVEDGKAGRDRLDKSFVNDVSLAPEPLDRLDIATLGPKRIGGDDDF